MPFRTSAFRDVTGRIILEAPDLSLMKTAQAVPAQDPEGHIKARVCPDGHGADTSNRIHYSFSNYLSPQAWLRGERIQPEPGTDCPCPMEFYL